MFSILVARKIANLREEISIKLTPVNSQFYVEHSNCAIGLENRSKNGINSACNRIPQEALGQSENLKQMVEIDEVS